LIEYLELDLSSALGYQSLEDVDAGEFTQE